MARNRVGYGGLALCATALVVAGGSALRAQDEVPPRLSLDLSSRLSQSSNPDLDVTGATARDRGDLSLGLAWASVTRDQDFRLSLGGLLRAEGGEAAFRDPSVKLSYARLGANGSFKVNASVAESPVDLDEPVELPGGGFSTSDILATTGTVTTTQGGLDFQTGTEGPFGLDLSLNRVTRDFSQTNDPSVYDTTTTRGALGVTLRGRFGGDIGLRYSQSQTRAEDATATARDSTSLSLTHERPLTPSLGLSLSLGRTEAETVKSGAVSSASSGVTGSLGLTQALANGSLGLRLSSDRDAKGTLQTLSLTHEAALANGSLAADLGWSARAGDAGTLVGKLAFAREMGADQITLSLSRSLSLDEDDADVARTALSADWSHAFSAATRLTLGLDLARIEAAGDVAVETVTRQSLAASLSHALPSDWELRGGVTVKSLERASTGRAEDSTVFVSIGRSFTLLP